MVVDEDPIRELVDNFAKHVFYFLINMSASQKTETIETSKQLLKLGILNLP